MEKAYFFVNGRDIETVGKVFREAGIGFRRCPCLDKPDKELVSFCSSPTEQKYIMGRLKDSQVEYTCP